MGNPNEKNRGIETFFKIISALILGGGLATGSIGAIALGAIMLALSFTPYYK